MSTSITRRSLLCAAAAVAAPLAPSHAAATPRSPAIGTGSLEAAVRARVEPFLEKYHLPGLGLAVRCGDRSAALGFGRASLPFDVPATPRTLFHLGSVGKHFTAIAALVLSGEGRYALEDPIGRFLGDIPDAWGSRSIASLLHHVSGIPDYNGPALDPTKPHTRAELIGAAAAQPILFDEGRAWSYSNTNYLLLGWLIEQASGLAFADYLTERILRRAGLKDARVDTAEQIVPRRAEPYTFDPAARAFRHAPRMDDGYSGLPDGPVLATPEDGVRWVKALDEHRLLSAADWARMVAPARLSSGRSVPYGCGLFVDVTHGRPFEWHTGGVPGFTTAFLRVPSLELGVLVCTNVTIGSSRVQRHVATIAAEIAAPGSTSLSLPPADDDRPDLTAAVRRILARGEGALDRSLLAPEMLTVVDGPLGERGVPRTRSGEPLDVALVEQRREGEAVLRRYRLSFPDFPEHYTVGHAPDGKAFWVYVE